MLTTQVSRTTTVLVEACHYNTQSMLLEEKYLRSLPAPTNGVETAGGREQKGEASDCAGWSLLGLRRAREWEGQHTWRPFSEDDCAVGRLKVTPRE